MAETVQERLRARARSISAASASMAASKTARNRATGDILAEYDFLRPEQTTEWKAADLIDALIAERDALMEVVDWALEHLEELREYMTRPERGEWGVECAVCRDEWFEAEDREKLRKARCIRNAIEAAEVPHE